MGGLGGRKLGVVVVVVVLAMWVGVAAPSSAPTPEIKTEAPPPPPGALISPKGKKTVIHLNVLDIISLAIHIIHSVIVLHLNILTSSLAIA